MTATKPLEMPLPLKIKKEKEESMSSEDSDDLDTDTDSTLLLQPYIFQNDCLSRIDSNDFLRLTSMVRRVYFSYLQKSIIKNYNTCCRSIKGEKLSRADLRKFCSLLELDAVKASIETSIYRQAVLKIISDVKKDTVNNKIHNKLGVYLDTPSKTVDVGVQTCFDKLDHTQDNGSLLNCSGINNIDNTQQDTDYPCPVNRVQVSANEVSNLCEKLDEQSCGGAETQASGEELKTNISVINNELKESEDRINKNIIDVFGNNSSNDIDDNDDQDTFNDVDNIDEDTHDTLVQHLETMFGDSDDSSDLMALIEKHSGINKPSVNMEPNETAKINSTKNHITNFNLNNENNSHVNNSSINSKKFHGRKLNGKEFEVNAGKRKVSFSDYKKLKKRSLGENKSADEEKEDKQTKKMRGVWLVERIHQESNLRAKMLELSVNDYRKYGRVKEKFKELFGDDEDGDDMMPESPIHIEEHLNACKERIAPWVVKHLMPYYEEKICGNKLLFKAVAKHVSDKLIIENTFPEEECVNKYIRDYFKNKECIKTEADIYI